MANVLNRTTREFLHSVHEPSYPVQDWIINPNLDAVLGFDRKYWVITGDAVTLMTQPQRDTVDATELEARRDATADELNQVEAAIRAFMLVVLDEFNAHADKHNAVLNAIDSASSLATLKTAVALIPDYPPRTAAQLKNSVRNKLGS